MNTLTNLGSFYTENLKVLSTARITVLAPEFDLLKPHKEKRIGFKTNKQKKDKTVFQRGVVTEKRT